MKISPAAPADPTRPTPSQTLAASADGSAWAVIACRLRAAPPTGWGTPVRVVAAGSAAPAVGREPAGAEPSVPAAGCSDAGASAAPDPDTPVAASGCPVAGCWGGAAAAVAGTGAEAGAGAAVPAVAALPAGDGESVVGAGEADVGETAVGDRVVVSGTGVGCGEAGAVAVSPSRPCSRPPTRGTKASPVTLTSGSSDLPSAWDAGTPAVRTSTAPIAAAAPPRRTPPWIPVREREVSDLCLTIVNNPSHAGG